MTQAAFAGPPTLTKPAEPIAAHGLMEESKKLQELAVADDAACIKLYEQMKKTGPKPDMVGKLSMHSKRLKRTAARLLSLGEPSGSEFERRYEIHLNAYNESFNTFQGLGPAKGFRDKAIAVLAKGTPKRISKAKEVFAKAESDPIAAQMILDPAVDDLESIAGVLYPQERGPFSEYMDAEAILAQATKSIRIMQVNAAVDIASAKFVADFDAFMQKLKATGNTIQAGKGSWGDKQLDAPELTNAVFQDGINMIAQLQKTIALQYLLDKQSAQGPPVSIHPQWGQRLQAIKNELVVTAIRILEMDTAASNTPPPLDRLSAHIAVMGKYAHRDRTDEWTKAFDDAVMKCAQRLGYDSKVKAYQSATNDSLAWRERFANKREVALANGIPSLKDVVTKVSLTNPTTPGYLIAEQGGCPHPQFYHSTYLTMPTIAKKFGQSLPAVVKNVVQLDMESPVWVSRWDNYIYANLPKDLIKSEFANPIRVALWVDDTHSPLSVRAASAIISAQRGDGLTVGGMIDDLAIEAALTRAIMMPENACPFLGIDVPTPFPRSLGTPLATVSMRATMTPVWIRHRYFVQAKLK